MEQKRRIFCNNENRDEIVVVQEMTCIPNDECTESIAIIGLTTL